MKFIGIQTIDLVDLSVPAAYWPFFTLEFCLVLKAMAARCSKLKGGGCDELSSS